jgi:signal transduction histidine kinase/CheY-like chemotaxis protein
MTSSSAVPGKARHRGSLFRRYTLYLALLVSLAVLVSGGLGAWFAYRDARTLVDELQREKARAAAARIEQFIRTAELQMKGAVVSGRAGGSADAEARQIELLRLLRIAPSISDAASLDAAGKEQVRVSRLERDRVGSGIDRSSEPAVSAARAGRSVGYGGIGFRHQSEPHLALAVSGNRPDDGLVTADVNLKFASEVVAGIKSGRSGTAYVVDERGGLIVHADSGLALRMSNLAHLPQVRAAMSKADVSALTQPTTVAGVDGGPRTIAAHATIEPLGWHVIVEQPLSVAFAPLLEAVIRTAALLVLGVVLAVVASLVLARRMTAPIRRLELGAQRIGDGHLNDRVEVHTGDELEALADQFNRMAATLDESYAGLERKVQARTLQLAEANHAKARFLAAASHDLRQPVHALGLFVAQLQASDDETARARLIGKVAACSAAVSDLIEALLDISKLDAGVVAAQPTAFALQPLFERIEQAYSPTAQHKGLRLRVRPTALWVRTDPMLVERILLNLCANAIRYTAQGGAILSARLRGKLVCIEVWDTGIGIAAEHQRHIFEEFYQVAGSSDEQGKGLGLGLAIVERLAGLLDLPLRVRSTQGRGSVFGIDVPLAHAAQESVSALSQLLVPARFEGLSVLLIDDDAAAREAVEGLLVQWGCVVACAVNAAGALRVVSDAPAPHLVICDYHLGNDELGTVVIEQIRTLSGRSIPAVILSADATNELQQATTAAGLHLLHKPLNAARLRALLMHVAGERQAATADH